MPPGPLTRPARRRRRRRRRQRRRVRPADRAAVPVHRRAWKTSAISRAWRSSIDRVMGRVGLHGKSFVPMLSGFSCAVPAVMATRTLENRTDRMLTMVVLPLMSCSARLPIYVLVIATVFAPGAALFGVVSVGRRRAVRHVHAVGDGGADRGRGAAPDGLRGPRPTLMLELPPYRRPVARVLLRTTWRHGAGVPGRGRHDHPRADDHPLGAAATTRATEAAARASRAERATIERTSPGARDARLAALGAVDASTRGDQLRHSVAGRARPPDRAGARAARLRLAHRRRHSRRVRGARSVRLDDGHRVRHQRRRRAEPAAARCAARARSAPTGRR